MSEENTKRRHTEKKEKYNIYGEGINAERIQIQKRDYIGNIFYREGSYMDRKHVRRENAHKNEEIIYRKKVHKKGI